MYEENELIPYFLLSVKGRLAMQKTDMEGCVSVSALDTNAADLTVVDVYDIAAIVGQEFERIIDQFGCESLLRLMPKVVRILEVLEVLVGRSTAVNPETEALRRELDRLRQERNDRQEKEKQHQKELESVEDEWRGEAQDLLLQITQLQGENKRLLINLSLKNSPITTEELQQHEGMSEKEQQMMNKLKDMVDKQRDEIRAKDHELTRRNEDIEALQMQQHRLMKINQDLRHRTGVVESRGKALIQQKAELEAAAQARHQELGALRLEAARLREERLEWELQREVVEKVEPVPTKAKMSPPTSAQRTSLGAETADSIKQNSVWVECGGDPGFLADCFESREGPSLLPSSAKKNGEDEDEDVGATALLLEELYEGGPEEVTDSLEKESEKPRFTLEELRDVLQERNELKSEVFMLQEELAYYKSEELEDEGSLVPLIPSPPLYPAPVDQPDSGIKRLIFTAIMPMVAAGLIGDDPTLMPIRRLISFV